MPNDRSVTLLDVTTRDGLQDENVVVPTARKLDIINALIAAGVTEIEATSFVHPKWVPQMADAEALVAMLPHRAQYSALIMNDRGFERALAAFDGAGFARGTYDLVFVASASPRHNKSNNNRTVDETLAYFDTIATRARAEGLRFRGAVACAFASPYPDESIDLETVAAMAERYAAGGAYLVCLADTIGKAEPETVARTVAAVRERCGAELSMHLHDLRGSALPNVQAGLDGGVRRFEGVLNGIGGCPFAPDAPGNLDLEKLTRYVEAQGFATGIDLERLAVAREVLLAALADGTPVTREHAAATA